MTQIDDFGREYLRLALEIDKHVAGYVDAYSGPAEIKAEVETGGKKSPAALLGDLARLRESIPTADPARHAYLSAVFRAMECTLRMQNGEEFDYLDEVNRLYDISPRKIDESVFTDAHQELDSLLPGQGNIADRMEARRKRYELPADRVLPVLHLIRDETRRRTEGLIDLVDGEVIDIKLVDDQPWSAYNWYLGNGRSLIEFNTDIPISALGLVSTFAHEAYPGHHTEAQLKEKLLYQEKGYAEYAAALLHSPSAVIAEGIAGVAVEMIFPDGGHHEWTVEVLLPTAGLPADESPERLQRIAEVSERLRYVSGNAAILFHTGQLDEERTIEYIRTYALSNEDRARKSFSFISHPLFRSYIFTYTQGRDLFKQATQGQDQIALFRRLLTEPFLPSQLAGMST